MSNVGVIDSITSKDITTKFGVKKKYSIKIDGTWYDAGWKKPNAVEGTTVSFNYKDGPYGKEIDGGLTPAVAGLGSGTSAAAPAKAAGSRGKYDAAPFPVPPLDPSRSIIRQNALRHATAIVLGTGAANNVDPAVVSHGVISIARILENYISGYDDVEAAKEEIAKE